jgi:hypothetical protein
MKRILALCLVLGACAQAPTAAQSVFAIEHAYTVAANAEVVAAPRLGAADRATMQGLDARAYTEIERLRAAAETGSSVATDTTAAVDAVAALASFLKGK